MESKSNKSEEQINCQTHGKQTTFLIVCKHLTEGTANEYVRVSEDLLLCTECAQRPLNPDVGRIVCKHCFAKILKRGARRRFKPKKQ